MSNRSTPDDGDTWRAIMADCERQLAERRQAELAHRERMSNVPQVHGQEWLWRQMSRPDPSAHERRRRLLHALHGWSCWLCGDPFPDFYAPCIEHVIPRSRGGTNDLRNLQLAHATCNSRKGNRLRCGFKPPTVWWDDSRGGVHLDESEHPKLLISGMWRERRSA